MQKTVNFVTVIHTNENIMSIQENSIVYIKLDRGVDTEYGMTCKVIQFRLFFVSFQVKEEYWRNDFKLCKPNALQKMSVLKNYDVSRQ